MGWIKYQPMQGSFLLLYIDANRMRSLRPGHRADGIIRYDAAVVYIVVSRTFIVRCCVRIIAVALDGNTVISCRAAVDALATQSVRPIFTILL